MAKKISSLLAITQNKGPLKFASCVGIVSLKLILFETLSHHQKKRFSLDVQPEYDLFCI